MERLPVIEQFTTPEEDALSDEFLRQGYVIRDVARRDALDHLRHTVVSFVATYLAVNPGPDDGTFLNNIHTKVPVERLNDMRLAIYHEMNSWDWFRATYFALGRGLTEALVGNELAMQNRVNLSIQFPDDDSSLLGLHSDIWSGESPFEVVQWVPFTDVEGTKSMFILPPDVNRMVAPRIKEIAADGGSEAVFERYREHFVWLTVPYGKVVIFSPTLMHGNIANSTSETRWSLNCRFKALFTPYTSEEQSLGRFYLPITTRVATRVGLRYSHPSGFEE